MTMYMDTENGWEWPHEVKTKMHWIIWDVWRPPIKILQDDEQYSELLIKKGKTETAQLV
jgi:hypothetical protein